MRQAAGAHAPYVLAAEAFCEAIFLPIPPDVLLAPMILRRRERAWVFALIVTLASVAGGCASYAIGYFASPLGQSILSHMGYAGDWPKYQQWFQQKGPWVILLKGLTPVPFALVTIASGLARLTFWKFLAACVAARVARFTLTTVLVLRFGPAVQAQVEKNMVLWGGMAIVLIVLVYLGLHLFLH